MAWEEKQDQLNQEARLFLASPEFVFEELKKLSAKTEFGRDDRLETVLVKRHHPLINLGLACYGANQEVFAALYKHSLAPAKDKKDAQYKKGLRIGCLSNTTLAKAHHVRDFPREIIGPHSHSLSSSMTGSTIGPELRKPVQEELWGGMFSRYSKYKTQRQQRRRQRNESLYGADDDLTDESLEDDAELASQRSGVEKVFGIVGYAWLVITNLLYLAIIAFVLNRTNQLDPKLTIVIATLGLVYITIRGLAMSQSLAFAPLLVGIAKSLDELKGFDAVGGGRRRLPEFRSMQSFWRGHRFRVSSSDDV